MDPRFHNTSSLPKIYTNTVKMKSDKNGNYDFKKINSLNSLTPIKSHQKSNYLNSAQVINGILMGYIAFTTPVHITVLKLILKLLSEPKAEKSIREVLYRHSPHIAEYYSTISNIGFFAVGIYDKDYSSIIAGTCSALSHIFPYQCFQYLDFAGIAVVVYDVCKNWNVLIERPSTLIYGAVALATNQIDTIRARQHQDKTGITHSIWHLSAAFAKHQFNIAKEELKLLPKL